MGNVERPPERVDGIMFDSRDIQRAASALRHPVTGISSMAYEGVRRRALSEEIILRAKFEHSFNVQERQRASIILALCCKVQIRSGNGMEPRIPPWSKYICVHRLGNYSAALKISSDFG
jgi:hypothetical protein